MDPHRILRFGQDQLLRMGVVEVAVFVETFARTCVLDGLVRTLHSRNDDRVKVRHRHGL